jgi:hypothetical protein
MPLCLLPQDAKPLVVVDCSVPAGQRLAKQLMLGSSSSGSSASSNPVIVELLTGGTLVLQYMEQVGQCSCM